jgi:hypothetical protein
MPHSEGGQTPMEIDQDLKLIPWDMEFPWWRYPDRFLATFLTIWVMPWKIGERVTHNQSIRKPVVFLVGNCFLGIAVLIVLTLAYRLGSDFTSMLGVGAPIINLLLNLVFVFVVYLLQQLLFGAALLALLMLLGLHWGWKNKNHLLRLATYLTSILPLILVGLVLVFQGSQESSAGTSSDLGFLGAIMVLYGFGIIAVTAGSLYQAIGHRTVWSVFGSVAIFVLLYPAVFLVTSFYWIAIQFVLGASNQ